MSEDVSPPAIGPAAECAEAKACGEAAEVRRLLHDMNNGLEIILQATYLVGTLELGDEGKQWLKLLEQGVGQVTALNQQLRKTLKEGPPA
jgi:hypothetical protein